MYLTLGPLLPALSPSHIPIVSTVCSDSRYTTTATKSTSHLHVVIRLPRHRDPPGQDSCCTDNWARCSAANGNGETNQPPAHSAAMGAMLLLETHNPRARKTTGGRHTATHGALNVAWMNAMPALSSGAGGPGCTVKATYCTNSLETFTAVRGQDDAHPALVEWRCRSPHRVDGPTQNWRPQRLS